MDLYDVTINTLKQIPGFVIKSKFIHVEEFVCSIEHGIKLILDSIEEEIKKYVAIILM